MSNGHGKPTENKGDAPESMRTDEPPVARVPWIRSPSAKLVIAGAVVVLGASTWLYLSADDSATGPQPPSFPGLESACDKVIAELDEELKPLDRDVTKFATPKKIVERKAPYGLLCGWEATIEVDGKERVVRAEVSMDVTVPDDRPASPGPESGCGEEEEPATVDGLTVCHYAERGDQLVLNEDLRSAMHTQWWMRQQYWIATVFTTSEDEALGQDLRGQLDSIAVKAIRQTD